MRRVGVYGCGVVGSAVKDGFVTKGFHVSAYDKFDTAHSDIAGVITAEAIFVCVPTPTNADGSQDLSALEETFSVLKQNDCGAVVVVKSTVLPGTTQSLADKYGLNKVVHNPEFLTAAKPYQDFMNQLVILLGSANQEAAITVGELYHEAGFTNIRFFSACQDTEIAKYMRNNYLAVKVGFFNEMYELCQKLGANYRETLAGMLAVGGVEDSHTSVPGPDGKTGFGGMCFPKDTKALLTFTKNQGVQAEVLEGAVTANARRRPEYK